MEESVFSDPQVISVYPQGDTLFNGINGEFKGIPQFSFF